MKPVSPWSFDPQSTKYVQLPQQYKIIVAS